MLTAIAATIAYSFCEIFAKVEADNGGHKYAPLKTVISSSVLWFVICITMWALGVTGPTGTVWQMIGKYPLMVVSPLVYECGIAMLYASLKYIPVFMESPLTSLSSIATFGGTIIILLFTGGRDYVAENMNFIKSVLAVLCFVGIFAVSFYEDHLEDKAVSSEMTEEYKNNKKKFTLIGILFCVLYIVGDTASSLIDVFYLTDDSENIWIYASISGIGTIAVAIAMYIFVCFAEKKVYNPFERSAWAMHCSGYCEPIGSVMFFIAMTCNPILSNMLISSACVFVVIFSRIFLKESIGKKQGVWLIITLLAIVAFSVADELM